MKSSVRRLLFALCWVGWFGLLPGTFSVMLATGHTGGTRLWWVSSAILTLAAWGNRGSHRRDPYGAFAAWMACGMTCGALADVYGSFAVIRFTEPLAMIVPLFALGHVCYIAGVFSVAGYSQLTRHRLWYPVLGGMAILYGLIGMGAWWTVVYPSEDLPHMQLPTAAYTLFLSMAAAVMATVATLNRRFLMVGIGGFLFLVSDILLAVRLFQNNAYGIGDFCWITYGIGQMFIVYGSLAACWTWEHEPNAKPGNEL